MPSVNGTSSRRLNRGSLCIVSGIAAHAGLGAEWPSVTRWHRPEAWAGAGSARYVSPTHEAEASGHDAPALSNTRLPGHVDFRSVIRRPCEARIVESPCHS